jgi:5-methylcytosine-specific restriction endonuclease McrA
MKGENNHFWRGGAAPDYRGSNWAEQRKKALFRDHFRCRMCGSSEDLCVHHIIAFKLYGKEHYEEANETGSLITLCRACHCIVEHHPSTLDPYL